METINQTEEVQTNAQEFFQELDKDLRNLISTLRVKEEKQLKFNKDQDDKIEELRAELAAERKKQEGLVAIPKVELNAMQEQKNQLDAFFNKFIGQAAPVIDIPLAKAAEAVEVKPKENTVPDFFVGGEEVKQVKLETEECVRGINELPTGRVFRTGVGPVEYNNPPKPERILTDITPESVPESCLEVLEVEDTDPVEKMMHANHSNETHEMNISEFSRKYIDKESKKKKGLFSSLVS